MDLVPPGLDWRFTVAWVLVGAAIFGVEFAALRARIEDGKGRTATAHLKAIRDMRRGELRLGLAVLALFWVWVTLHVFTDLKV